MPFYHYSSFPVRFLLSSVHNNENLKPAMMDLISIRSETVHLGKLQWNEKGSASTKETANKTANSTHLIPPASSYHKKGCKKGVFSNPLCFSTVLNVRLCSKSHIRPDEMMQRSSFSAATCIKVPA